MDAQKLEFELAEKIEQVISESGMMYFTYNRGIEDRGDHVLAQIELKGSKHSFNTEFKFNKADQTLSFSVLDSEGTPPQGAQDKLSSAMSSQPDLIVSLFL